MLNSSRWRNNVIGRLSSFQEFNNETKNLLEAELSWATHVSLPAVVIEINDIFSSYDCVSYICQKIMENKLVFWVKVPFKSYDKWLKLSQLVDFHANLQLAFILPYDVPLTAHEDIDWLNIMKFSGERLKAVYIGSQVYTKNKNGYPILTARHQHIIQTLGMYTHKFVITGECTHPDGVPILKEFLTKVLKHRPEQTVLDKNSHKYRDLLQSPLQPLQDHLLNETYEVFEKDPVKYERYKEAIRKALKFLLKTQNKVKILVAGAGRAPLVKAVIKACEELKVDINKISLFAVEKNVNAIRTIKHLKEEKSFNENNSKIEMNLWKNLKVYESDMRVVFDDALSKSIDILVSELLGSFGDNELSPECIDGSKWLLHGKSICIPHSYISYLSPISYAKGWEKLKTYKELKYLDTIYVTYLYQHYRTSTIEPCFEFTHSPSRQNTSNERSKEINFEITHDSIIHGFAGYFTATLYDDIKISINPDELHLSPNMFSWFPCFIPLRVPTLLKKNTNLKIHISRNSKANKVWYQWCLLEPTVSNLQNINGDNYSIGLLTQ